MNKSNELKTEIHDDRSGLDYVLAGDYYIPMIEMPMDDDRPIGKWGAMHRTFLEETNRTLLNHLILTGRLHTCLADLNEQAQDRYQRIIRRMAEAEGVDDDLKRRSQWDWIRAMNSAVYNFLVKLCADICRRNGKKLLWLGDKTKTLNYFPKPDEMVLTVHRWFANKSCPGDWLYSMLGDLATKVTKALGGSGSSAPADKGKTLYRVRRTWEDAKTQKGAFSVFANAKKRADENAGYSVFDKNGNNVYTGKQTSSGSGFNPYTVRVAISDLNI